MNACSMEKHLGSAGPVLRPHGVVRQLVQARFALGDIFKTLLREGLMFCALGSG